MTPALMSIGCPYMRWFLGLFLCRLVPVRRWLQTFILWLSDLCRSDWDSRITIELIPGSWWWMLSSLLLKQPLGLPWTLSNCMIRHRSFKWVAVTRTCYRPDVVGIYQIFRWMLSAVCYWGSILFLKEIFSYQNLFVVSPMVRSINYFWVLPTLSIQSKGSDSL